MAKVLKYLPSGGSYLADVPDDQAQAPPSSAAGPAGGIRAVTGGVPQQQNFSPTGGMGTYSPNGGVAGGAPPLSQSAYEQQQQTQLEAKLGADAEQRRLALIQQMGGSDQARVSRGSSIGADENAARAAAFARAKEQAGQTAAASLKTITDIMASRGLAGSTNEGVQQARVVSNAGAGVNEFTREQLMQDLNRAADVADTTYAGDITQRGQDLNRQQSLLGLLAGGRLY